MNAAQIERWIRELGCTRGDLVCKSVLPDSPLEELFADDDEQFLIPIPGVNLVFDKVTRRLKKITIALKPFTSASSPYSGDLPQPFTRNMTQMSVRKIFGTPLRSIPSKKAPKPVGQIGGADIYLSDSIETPNVEIGFAYNTNLEVANLVFVWTGVEL